MEQQIDISLPPFSLHNKGELDVQESLLAKEIKEAYGEFWKSNIRFSKGWEKPAFQREEVEEFLDEAAETVALILSHLRNKQTSNALEFSVTLLCGSAKEYLWGLQFNHVDQFHPYDDPEKFVRELVIETFRSGNTFIQDSSQDDILKWVDVVKEWRNKRKEERLTEVKHLESNIQKNLDETKSLISKIFTMAETDKREKKYLVSLENILKDFSNMQFTLNELQATAAAQKEKQKIVENYQKKSQEVSKLAEAESKAESKPAEAESKAETTPAAAESKPAEAESKAESKPAEAESKAESKPAEAESKAETKPAEAESKAETKPAAAESKPAEAESKPAEAESKPAEPESKSAPAETNAAEVESKAETKPAAAESKPAETKAAEPDTQPAQGETKAAEGESKAESKPAEAESKSAEASQDPKDIAPKLAEYKLQIHKVKEDVEDHLRPEIQNLLSDFEKLGTEDDGDLISKEKKINSLNKQCLAYTNQLIKDLIALDSIVGEGVENVRDERKEEVRDIQKLLTQVETVHNNLKELHNKVATQRQASPSADAASASAPHEEKAPSAQQEAPPKEEERGARLGQQELPKERADGDDDELGAAVAIRERPKTQTKKKRGWKDMKLNPKFEVAETPSAYVIGAYIPGMREEDIKITLSGEQQDVLNVRGLREPNSFEEMQIRTHLKQLNIQEYTSEADAMLLWGAGRFGAFSQSYKLPQDALAEEISADYQKGILKVIVPREQAFRRGVGYPQRAMREQFPMYRQAAPPMYTQGGRPLYRQPQAPAYQQPQRTHAAPMGNPYFNPFTSFFDDDDVWW